MKWLVVALALLLAPATYSQDPEELCLAKAIYYESRGQPIKGQKAVAQVVLNRANNPVFPNSICGVVYQKAQFSWVGTKIRKPKGDQWELAKELAKEAIEDGVILENFKALYFHSTSVRPRWGKKLYAKIGGHLFFA